MVQTYDAKRAECLDRIENALYYHAAPPPVFDEEFCHETQQK